MFPTWLLLSECTSPRDLHPDPFSVAAWNPFSHKPLQLAASLQLLIAASLAKKGVPPLGSPGKHSQVGGEELLLSREVEVGPSEEAILVLGGELTAHLLTFNSCLQRLIVNEGIFIEPEEVMESTEEKEQSSIPLQVTNGHKTDPILVYRSASSALQRVKIRETPP